MKSPSFQLYVRDALCSLTIKRMTGDEFKAYFLLLCNSWLETPRATLPNNEEDLAAYAGVSLEQWEKLKPGVMKAFIYVDNLEDNLPDKLKDNPQYKGDLNLYHNRWYNERLLEVSIKQKKDSDNGKKGGNPKLTPGNGNPYYPKKDNPQDNPSDKPEDKGDDKHSSSSSSSILNNIYIGEGENPVGDKVEETVDPKKKRKLGLEMQAASVMDYLNEKAKRNFKTGIDLIVPRLNEGYSIEDCKRVIDAKVKQWQNNEFRKYLRPKTLFNKTNFDGYINELPNQGPTNKIIGYTIRVTPVVGATAAEGYKEIPVAKIPCYVHTPGMVPINDPRLEGLPVKQRGES